ncbi:hypothetical protein ACFYXS_13040 [Streptomyces sp. NPDC002574]|uniref:hypothetical protein n=1 Tax=Streptomyces sp. NPDC002574 TaxID=3364652 RepID=UPI00369E597A
MRANKNTTRKIVAAAFVAPLLAFAGASAASAATPHESAPQQAVVAHGGWGGGWGGGGWGHGGWGGGWGGWGGGWGHGWGGGWGGYGWGPGYGGYYGFFR